jgi:hypothetical protein
MRAHPVDVRAPHLVGVRALPTWVHAPRRRVHPPPRRRARPIHMGARPP